MAPSSPRPMTTDIDQVNDAAEAAFKILAQVAGENDWTVPQLLMGGAVIVTNILQVALLAMDIRTHSDAMPRIDEILNFFSAEVRREISANLIVNQPPAGHA